MYTLETIFSYLNTPKVPPYSQYELLDHSNGTRRIIQGEAIYHDENVAVIKGRFGVILVFDIKTKRLKTDGCPVINNNNEYTLYVPKEFTYLSVEKYQKSLEAFYSELEAQGLNKEEVQRIKNNDIINNALVAIYSELISITKK